MQARRVAADKLVDLFAELGIGHGLAMTTDALRRGGEGLPVAGGGVGEKSARDG